MKICLCLTWLLKIKRYMLGQIKGFGVTSFYSILVQVVTHMHESRRKNTIFGNFGSGRTEAGADPGFLERGFICIKG